MEPRLPGGLKPAGADGPRRLPRFARKAFRESNRQRMKMPRSTAGQDKLERHELSGDILELDAAGGNI